MKSFSGWKYSWYDHAYSAYAKPIAFDSSMHILQLSVRCFACEEIEWQ